MSQKPFDGDPLPPKQYETARDALAHARDTLAASAVPNPAQEARRLLRLARSRALPFDEIVSMRAARHPFSHIAGERFFWKHRFAVSAWVLDPRPESETLIEAALRFCKPPPESILDLGTGSGCLLLSLLREWPEARGTGTDICEAALDVARRNAASLELAGRCAFRQANWLDGETERYGLILCNPPYVPDSGIPALAPEVRNWEPRRALSGGADGLDAFRAIIPRLPACLEAGGWVVLEIGAGQKSAVCALLAGVKLMPPRLCRDLDSRARSLAVKKK